MVRLSMPRVTRTGSGSVGPVARLSAIALTTSNGRRRSAPVKMRSRSICRAASVAAARGAAPNSNFAEPVRWAGRASGPYWNSRSSTAAPAEVALTLAVTFHGSWMAVVPSGSAAPTTRDTVIAPSKRGAFRLDPHGAVGIERHRRRGCIDEQTQLYAAVVAAAAATEAKRVRAVAGGEAALALERTEQRAHLAAEIEIIEREPTAAGGVGQNDAAVRDREPVDADAIGIKAEARDRRRDPAGPVELAASPRGRRRSFHWRGIRPASGRRDRIPWRACGR